VFRNTLPPADQGQSSYQSARRLMVQSQLKKRGITDPRVLAAMDRAPREAFMEGDVSPEEAYADRAWQIECGQTISQPYIVALMTQALELSGDEHVLEVGTGSGYQAAVLAELAGDVVTIERHAELSEKAGQTLRRLGYTNVTPVVGDGTLGWPERAPYDRIIVTAAAPRPPEALWDQLRETGIFVLPIGGPEGQELVAIRKRHDRPVATKLSPCRFVPLVGEAGFDEEE
jgi:protein-L-isoaspartate(D-aspartate) O-methyltransferase